jgi:two-component system response regulator AtoC
VAKAIHQHSDRKNALFVAVNCAAIPAEMLESELFGYEKGAFTGAVKDRVGKFELAEGGTIFLDEITEMPINLQAKLLRALQEGVIEKLGGNRQISLDIRVVAATNRDPLQAVKEGKLREDLYYRLNVFQLQIPALRERGEDIQLITQAYLDKKSAQINDEALQKLSAYSWPGNVRELQNVLERATILAGGKPITPQHLPADIASGTQFYDRQLSASQGSEAASSGGAPTLQVATEGYSIPQAIAQIERQLIVDAIAACKGNKSKAAKLLEISERSLWYKLEQYQLK